MSTTTTECPKCRGCGEYAALSCRHWGPCDCDGADVECEECDGTGQLEADDDAA